VQILFITQLFQPEPNLLTGVEFARQMQKFGHEVQVLTGFPNYPDGKLYPGYRISFWQREWLDGVEVIRVPVYPSHDRSAFRRALCYLSLAVSMTALGPLLVRKADVAFVYAGPMTLCLPAIVLKWFRAIPFILSVQDLWPESVTDSGMLRSKWASALISGGCSYAYRKAAHMVALSEGYKGLLIARGARPEQVTVIHNWCHPAYERMIDFKNGSDLFNLNGTFNVVHTGNLGELQALDSVIHAAKLLQTADPHVRLVFVGSGTRESHLKQMAAQLGLRNVVFVSRLPLERLPDVLRFANLLLVHLKDEPLTRVGIPQKTQAYLASGIPILCAVEGEVANLVKRSGAGFLCRAESPRVLADAILSIASQPPETLRAMGLSGRNFYRENLSFSVGSRRLADVFESVAGSSRKGTQTALSLRKPEEIAQSAPFPSRPGGFPNIELFAPQHLDDAVTAHLAAFPGFYLSWLGRQFLREFYAAFLHDRNSVAFVASDARGRALGVIVGPLDPAGFFRNLVRRRWWAFGLASMNSILRRPWKAWRVLRAVSYRGESPPGPVRALLSSVAVLPEAQGFGIGRKLVSRWVEEVRHRGVTGCYLLTDAEGNDRVNSFYRSLDWKLEFTNATPEGRKVNRYILDFAEPALARGEPLGPLALANATQPGNTASASLKRLFDILLSGTGLAVLSPLLLLVSLAVRISSAGPVFFRQVRVGQCARCFRMVKFRSMVRDAPRLGPGVTRDGDPRITKLGRFLRKAKLDELPQLWNVLAGDMTLVGPRPELPCYVEKYTPEQRRVLQLKPGITDLATLEFRDEEELLETAADPERFYLEHCVPQKIELNLAYARRANLWEDLKIIFRTLFALLPGIPGRKARRSGATERTPLKIG